MKAKYFHSWKIEAIHYVCIPSHLFSSIDTMQRQISRRKVEVNKSRILTILGLSSRWAQPLFKAKLFSRAYHLPTELGLQCERRIWVRLFSFELQNFRDQESVQRFRSLKKYVLRISTRIKRNILRSELRTVRRRYKFIRIEAPRIMLRLMRTPNKCSNLEPEVGRHKSALVEIFYHIMEVLYKTFHPLVCAFQADLFIHRGAKYATALKEKGSPLPNCNAFINGTKLQIWSPAGITQRATYSGQRPKTD